MNTNQEVTPKPSFPVVPTTKVMAIGQFTTPQTPEQIKEIFPHEVPETLKLYLSGKIDQWWVKQTQTGPVFLMNVTSVQEAHAILEELPLGKAGLMKFEFHELGPLTPLHMLLTDGLGGGPSLVRSYSQKRPLVAARTHPSMAGWRRPSVLVGFRPFNSPGATPNPPRRLP
jgi:hypothetical protein